MSAYVPALTIQLLCLPLVFSGVLKVYNRGLILLRVYLDGCALEQILLKALSLASERTATLVLRAESVLEVLGGVGFPGERSPYLALVTSSQLARRVLTAFFLFYLQKS